jgi:multiple sugar transport system ATP-binding protein
MASVEIINVTKIYENKAKAVDQASLQVNDGEFTVLVGPSGCGKSTLLRMIAGLEEISEGTIKIGDKAINNVPSKDRDIAMVFQNYALYPHMTVYQNMAFGLKLRKYPKNEIDQRVNEAAEILDLREFLHRKPKQLSGGQRQRVAVGRAIVRKPAVFLFDEPLSNLDAKLRVQMRLEISKLHKQLSTTMIYVTHDQVEAMTMGERIVVLNRGQIQQYDTPLNVYNFPVNKFVAGFIGSPAMNFISGDIDKRDNQTAINLNGSRWVLTKEISQKINDAQCEKVILGIRPEHLKFQTEKFNEFPDIETIIELIEPMGNELFVHLSMESARLTMRCLPDVDIKAGENIKLAFDPKNVHFFSSDSGDLI